MLAVVVALVAGLAVGLLAGSRRSGSALDRALRRLTPFDLQVATKMAPEDLAALPGVERAALNPYVAMQVVRRDGTLGLLINGIGLDWDLVGGFSRVVGGRLPDGSDPFSVIVNEAAAKAFDVGPGDDLKVRTFGLDQAESLLAGDYSASGPTYTFHVGAVYRSLPDLSADEVTGPSQIGNQTQLIVPNTFYFQHSKDFLTFDTGYQIRLHDHTGVDQFRSAFTARSNQLGLQVSQESFSSPLQGSNGEALRSPIGFETTLLLVLGLLTAGAGLAVVTLLLRADQRAFSADDTALQALGFTRRQLVAVAAARAVPVGAFGALGALTTALFASTFFPVGLGRLVEPTPGVDANVAVLAIGLVCTMVGVVGVGAAVGLTSATRPTRANRARVRSALLAGSIIPATATFGARLIFDRCTSRQIVIARQAVLGGALAVALVLGVGGYDAGLSHLHDDGPAHGFPWDAMVGNVYSILDGTRLADLRNDPSIGASSEVAVVDVLLDGYPVSLWAQDTSVTAVGVMVLRGRAPRSESEIALGARTLRKLGRHIGDTTELAAKPGAPVASMTIVGVVLLPGLQTEVGSGLLITLDGLARLAPDVAPQLMVVRLRDNVDRSAAINRLIEHHSNEVTLGDTPAQIANLWRVRWLPLLGAAIVGLLGTVLVVYTLSAAAHAQARELAVFRSLGMTSGGVRSVVAWQGVLIAGVVSVLGVPLGLIGGTAVWRSIANHMGVGGHVVISPWVVVVVPVVVTVAVLALYVPARRAGNARVATALRSE